MARWCPFERVSAIRKIFESLEDRRKNEFHEFRCIIKIIMDIRNIRFPRQYKMYKNV